MSLAYDFHKVSLERRARMGAQTKKITVAREIVAPVKEVSTTYSVENLQLTKAQLLKLRDALSEAIGHDQSDPVFRPKVREIIKEVAIEFGVTINDLFGKRRVKKITTARQVACYLARRLTIRSYPEIGAIMNLDHTTVLHAYRKIQILIHKDDDLIEKIARLGDRLTRANINDES